MAIIGGIPHFQTYPYVISGKSRMIFCVYMENHGTNPGDVRFKSWGSSTKNLQKLQATTAGVLQPETRLLQLLELAESQSDSDFLRYREVKIWRFTLILHLGNDDMWIQKKCHLHHPPGTSPCL